MKKEPSRTMKVAVAITLALTAYVILNPRMNYAPQYYANRAAAAGLDK